MLDPNIEAGEAFREIGSYERQALPGPAETRLFDSGAWSAISLYVNAKGDGQYDAAAVNVYALSKGQRVLVKTFTTSAGAPLTSQYLGTVTGFGADAFQVAIVPAGVNAPTKPIGISYVAFGDEASGGGGAATPVATGATTGTITLAGDLQGTGSAAAAPLVGSLTGIAGTLALASTAALIQWASATVAPTVQQADNTTAAATGQILKVRGQNATGGGATGGALALSSGSGTASPGSLLLQTGGTTRLTLTAATLTATVTVQASGMATDNLSSYASFNPAAFINAGVTSVTVGNVASATNFVLLGGVVTLGAIASASATGAIRLANNVTAMAARNAANTADVSLINLSAGNLATFGDSTNATGASLLCSTTLTAKAGTVGVTFASSGTISMVNTGAFNLGSTSGASTNALVFTFADTGATTMLFSASVTSAIVGVLATTTAAGIALTLRGQNTTFAASNGGDVVLQPGTGTSASGLVSIVNPTTTAGATAGASGAPPGQVAGYLSVRIAGTVQKIPYYAV